MAQRETLAGGTKELMEDKIQELTNELLALEGKAPITPAPVIEPDDVVTRLKRSFDMLLAQDRHRDFDAEERARVANLKAIEPEPKPKPAEIVPEPKQSTVADQVKAASRLCDIELVKLEEKIAALKAETGG
jgi:hypothetical protein